MNMSRTDYARFIELENMPEYKMTESDWEDFEALSELALECMEEDD